MSPPLHRVTFTLLALVAAAAPLPALQQITGVRVPLTNPCATSLSDQAGGPCLEASSVPALGSLYPLSNDLFVDPVSGWLGLGTTNPAARLSVSGNARVYGDLSFGNVANGVLFSSSNAGFETPAPMLTMFGSGTVNPDRMVLGHSPNYPEYGLMYRDQGDQFIFQRANTDPVMTVDLNYSRVDVDGHLQAQDGMHLLNTNNLNAFDVYSFYSSTISSSSVIRLHGPEPTVADYNYIRCQQYPGTSNPYFRVDEWGNVFADGSFTGPADFAEMIQVGTGAESVEAGDLLVIDPQSDRSVIRSSAPRSRLVIGVYSTEPGFVGSERDWDEEETSLDRSDMALMYDEVPVAVVGIVPVKASAENGPIRRGDLLVSSSTPGHVMRDDDPRAGTIVGKALAELEGERGQIRMLVSLQ